MKTVCVLVSTYDGEKYIGAQLDSVLAQEGVDIRVHIRDDGSNDGTLEILEKYTEKDARLVYYQGNNIGPARSFFKLLNESVEFDYYSFCDQDDVWDPDKLKIAIDMLEKNNQNIPLLYYSNLRIVDEQLNFYRFMHNNPVMHKSKFGALTDNLATGCTVVINNKLAQMVRGNIPENCTMHDAWLYIVAMFFGKVIYDFNPHISYRQHRENAVGTYLRKQYIKSSWSSFTRLFNRSLQPRYMNAVNFYNIYGTKLSREERREILKIVNYKKSFLDKLKLFTDFNIRCYSMKREINFRISILLGIM